VSPTFIVAGLLPFKLMVGAIVSVVVVPVPVPPEVLPEPPPPEVFVLDELVPPPEEAPAPAIRESSCALVRQVSLPLSSATQSFFVCDSSLLTMRDQIGIGEEFLTTATFATICPTTNFVNCAPASNAAFTNSSVEDATVVIWPVTSCRMPPMERSEPGWSATSTVPRQVEEATGMPTPPFDLQGRCCTHFRH